MHPFLNYSKLSDDDLVDKLSKAREYMNFQISVGHTPAVQSIREVILALEEERSSRITRQIDEENKKKNPKSMAPIELGRLED